MRIFTLRSIVVRTLGIFTFILLSTIAIFAQEITIDEFIGINIRRDMPVDKMQAVGFVREYHRGALDQGFPALNETQETASPVYPLTQYKFNPSYQTQAAIPFDTYYDDITSNGLEIGVSLFQSFPWMWDSETTPITPQLPDANNILEQKPMYPGNDPLVPNSYLAHADWMYQYAARYGNTTFSTAKTNQIVVPRLHPDETPVTGLARIEYYEDWNEPDKWWLPQLPSTYFTPEEYAVMLSADADGHQQTMGLVSDPDNPGQMISVVGIKNADPTAKVVATGLSDFDLEYIEDMVDWFTANRSANGPNGKYPFDVLSFHHYSNTGQELNQLGLNGISPEDDLMKQKMLPITAYRDQNFPDAELWLSEFGYDVDSLSGQRVPWDGIGNADREEIQAQWIIRSYLETAAAGFDRAMLYELRDACDGELCGLFQVSGLTERDYSPRKSWYYVYTMKNILSGYVYESESSPCQETDCNVDCPRVYSFVNPNDSSDKIYALWSPTSCDKPAYNYALDLGGANSATLIEMNAPSTVGVNSSLFGNTVNVPITERPVFVRVGLANNSPIVNCVNNLQMAENTCSSARVSWSAPADVSEVDVWTFPAGTTDFDLFDGQFIAENIPVSEGNFNITGLNENTSYTVVLFARDANGNVSEACSTNITTGETTCKIEIDPSWIYDFSGVPNAPTELFDEQANHDPICGDGGEPNSIFGFSAGNPNDLSVSIDLQDYYNIDAFYLYDAQDYSTFTIEYSTTPNGPWQVLSEYFTQPFAEWVTLDNLLPSDTAVRYLRFTSDGDDRALIGEVILCGRNADFDDSNLPPSAPIDFVYTGNSCNSLRFAWEAPLETDITGYQINYAGQTVTIPATAANMTYELFNLNTQESYNITARTLDADGNLSTPISLTASTLSNAECNTNCDNSCSCRICLQPSWIQNLTPADGIDPTRLVDEQGTNPICGAGTSATTEWGENYDVNSGVPPMIAIVDLQRAHDLSSIYIFDGSGSGILKIEYQDENGDWQLIENYLTAKNFEWHEFGNLGITTRHLRLTKESNQAKINEIAICGLPCVDCTIPAGTACDDSNNCTENDVYNANCNCAGTFADADNDGVCDTDDICPTGDDNADNDNDGTPNACDSTPNGEENNDCDYLNAVGATVSNATCPASADGEIQLNIPNCPGGGTGGGTPVNLAANGTTTQSSTNYSADGSRAIDGNTDGNFWGTLTCSATSWDVQPWWQIDLGEVSDISSINIWNRTDCCQDDLSDYYILVSSTPFASDDLNALLSQNNITSFLQSEIAATPSAIDIDAVGRYVRIQGQGTGFLVMAEVEIMGESGGGGACTYSYNWSDGIGDTDNPTGLAAGTYQVTITDNNNCTESLNITVGNEEADSDGDGVCDSVDICPTGDDNADNDNDGVPNACDTTPDGGGNEACDYLSAVSVTVSNATCPASTDGEIQLNLPDCPDDGTGGGTPVNLALTGTATQSSTNYSADASRAIDGNTDGNFWSTQTCSATAWNVQPWWEVDLGEVSDISSINIWNRTDCCDFDLTAYYILVSSTPFASADLDITLFQNGVNSFLQGEAAGTPSVIDINTVGRYVRIQKQGTGFLILAEVEVIGESTGGGNCTYTYNWSDGIGDTDNPTDLAAGTYQVTITDNNNCVENLNITVGNAEADSDNDGVCDSADICAGFDDNADNDNDGIPNGCDSTPDGGGTGMECADFDLTYTSTDESCDGENDGSIEINLPCTGTGGGGGGETENLALNGTATQLGTTWGADASRANDGNTDGNFWATMSVTGSGWNLQPWWELDLGQVSTIETVNIWNRTDCCNENLTDYYVLISETPFTASNLFELTADPNITAFLQTEEAGLPTTIPTVVSGRYVRIQLLANGILSLAEVEVMGSAGGGACNLSTVWSGGLGADAIQENLAPGTYNVSVTDNLENCTETATITIAASSESCTALSINCPADIEVEASAGSNSALATWNTPSVNSSCTIGNVSLTQTGGLPSGSEFTVGSEETISYSATDDCGNTASCSFVVRTDGEVISGGPAPDNYCGLQADEPWWQWINRVTFADIDNQTNKEGYGDYTSIETAVNLGGTYDITLLPEFSWLPFDEHWRVWIDFNRDGDFEDAGEMVFEDHGTAEITGSISIPNNSSLGKTRMRISMQDSEYAEPCGSYQYGEVEDYIVDIQTMISGFVQQEYLTFDVEKSGRNVRLHWTTNTTTATDNFILEQSENSLDFYEIHQRPVGEEEYTQAFDFYDAEPEQGVHYYRLRQEMRNGAYRYSEIRRLDFDLDIDAISVFPNPTSGDIKVALHAYLGEQVTVKLLNQYGQTLEEKRFVELTDELASFDMKRYPDGLYFISVQAEGKRVITRRFVVGKL